MYIEIYNKKNQFAKIGRKLFKKMNFKKGHPTFIQIVKLKGSDKFAIIKRTSSETFKTQCNMVERTGERDTPGKFFFTIPSLEYFIAITGINIHGSRILKVREKETNGIKYFEICE